MNVQDTIYKPYSICKEMLEVPLIIRSFNPSLEDIVSASLKHTQILLTGEGSSRIFPAKQAIWKHYKTTRKNLRHIFTESSLQAMEYDLANTLVLGVSNSGKTKELLLLLRHVQSNYKEHSNVQSFGICSSQDNAMRDFTIRTHILSCGAEAAVAATKSVVEQALCVEYIAAKFGGDVYNKTGLVQLADAFQLALQSPIDSKLVQQFATAKRVYFMGRNNGVAEELTLKTNEIVRKQSTFLEGTYALHGIEEVMHPDEVLVLIDPYKSEEEKIEQHLAKTVGIKIFAIASKPTRFPTILYPDVPEYEAYLQLALGWNLLVDAGLHLQIDIDKPKRARKVGNSLEEG